ncbi:hypothetical protein Tco_0784079 [Tanacetum coccineum]
MEKKDPAIVTKSLANDFDNFIANLSSDQVKSTNNAMGSSDAAAATTGASMSVRASQVDRMASFATVVQEKPIKKVVKIKELRNSEVVEGAAVAIPIEAVEEVSSRFVNTLYGYFIGKRLAFPLVENYVKHTWAKYGLKRVQLHEEFFLFQFDTKEGMVSVMENGPWLIRLVPLMLNVWTPNTDLKKEEIKRAPIWVKLHHVPIVAYSEVGLRRSTYARVLIEVLAEKDLMESIIIAIPLSNGKGHTFATIDIEYEWQPPRCSTCQIFDHVTDQCPKLPKVVVPASEKDDGFAKVKRKKNKVKQHPKARPIDGIRLNKPMPNFYYRKVEKGEASKVNVNEVAEKAKGKITAGNEQDRSNATDPASKPKEKSKNTLEGVTGNTVALKNSFSSLEENDGGTDWEFEATKLNVINESDSDELEELMMEGPTAMNTGGKTSTGASTLAVRHVISENSLSICAILKSHVSDSNLVRLCSLVFRHWDWTSNGICCSKGTRIILGWNHNDVDLVVINQDDQAIHTRVWLKMECKEIFCLFVYAHNRYTHRRALWHNLCVHKQYVRDRPWCLLGDFNAALFLEDSSAGSSSIDISMREFKECVEEIKVLDVQRSGLQFTWNQKPKGKDGLLKKIDRIMANLEFIDGFVGAHAIFKPYRIYDHSPSVLNIPTIVKPKPRPFKFFNIITQSERFKEVVMQGWSLKVSGFCMFRVVKRLKHLKNPLRKLLYEKGNLHDNVKRLHEEMDLVQTSLDMDPSNATLRENEARSAVAFIEAVLMEERFLKQKAKIDWLREGDSNSAYFYKAVKSRISRSRIDVVANVDGTIFENDKVADVFVSHYEQFLGLPGTTSGFDYVELFRNIFIDARTGPDGLTVAFSKILGNYCEAAIMMHVLWNFFTNGKISQRIETILSLLYSKDSLRMLVSVNQSAFIPGRSIADNILLTQELMHNYHLDCSPPRCAFKVDIQKAYDTVDWNFLEEVLHGFGFHDRMVGWIMECVTTSSFSISINGSLHGYFKGKRGLRQGDPLSPYLFTLVMEILTLMLRRRVHGSTLFTYHRYCSELELINLCFADDLFLFMHGDVNSASLIKDALEEFKDASGLIPSLPKSTAYFCNVLNHTKVSILNVLPFDKGRLPVKYLGVPLVSSRLILRDCKELVEKVQSRVQD